MIQYSIIMLELLCCRAVKSLHGIHWRKRVISVQNEVNYINSKVSFCIWKIFHHGLAFFVQSSRLFGGKSRKCFCISFMKRLGLTVFPHLLEKKNHNYWCILYYCSRRYVLWISTILFSRKRVVMKNNFVFLFRKEGSETRSHHRRHHRRSSSVNLCLLICFIHRARDTDNYAEFLWCSFKKLSKKM